MFQRTALLASAAALFASGLFAQQVPGSGTVNAIRIEEKTSSDSAAPTTKAPAAVKAEAQTVNAGEVLAVSHDDGEILIATIDAAGNLTTRCVHGMTTARKAVVEAGKAPASTTPVHIGKGGEAHAQ
jgi:hypothetical protein